MIKQVASEYIGRTNGVIMPLMMTGLLFGSSISRFIVFQLGLFGAYFIVTVLTALCAILTIKMNNHPAAAEYME